MPTMIPELSNHRHNILLSRTVENLSEIRIIHTIAHSTCLAFQCNKSIRNPPQPKSCKTALVLTISIVNLSVCESAHNTSIIKMCSLSNCKMIPQLLQANRFVPLHHMYVVIATHLAICKIGTVTAGCHRIPIPITDRAKQLWGS